MDESSQLAEGPASSRRRREINDEVKSLNELRGTSQDHAGGTRRRSTRDVATSRHALTSTRQRTGVTADGPPQPSQVPRRHGSPSATRSSSSSQFERVLLDLRTRRGPTLEAPLPPLPRHRQLRLGQAERGAYGRLGGSQESVSAPFGDPERIHKARHAFAQCVGRSLVNRSVSTPNASRSKSQAAKLPDTRPVGTTLYRECLPSEVRPLVEAEIRRAGIHEPTVQQLIDIALSFAWEPPATRAPQEAADRTRKLPSDPRQSAPLPVTW